MLDPGGGGGSGLPSALLTTPSATEPMPDIAQMILGWQDKISIAYGINWAIEQVCGYNFFEEFSKDFTGDWHGVSEAGYALRKLGDYCASYGSKVQIDMAVMLAGWDGNAADAAEAYFTDLAQRITDMQSALDDLAKGYQQTATGIYLAGQTMQSAIQELCDLLIALGLELLATASTSWTGVGAVIGGAASAYTAWEARQVWLEVVKWHGRAVAAAQGMSGLCASGLSLVHGLQSKPLPGGAYDNTLA